MKYSNPGLELWSWDEFTSNQTGGSIADAAAYEKRKRRHRRNDELTRRIADLLQDQGIKVFRNGEAFALVGLITGMVSPAEQQYRRMHFLPTVAATLRAQIANALDLYLSIHRRRAHYGVITSGVRCQLGELRGRITRLNRLISRWHHEICAPLGIDLLFRSIELPCNDGLTFHVHANVVYQPMRYLQPRKWARFLRQTRAFFDAHWNDNGQLEDAREVVKYIMKGDELERIADRAPHLVAQLYHQLQGLHLVQALGSFRAFRHQLDDDRLKVVPIYDSRRRRLVVVRRPKRQAEDREAAASHATNHILGIDLPRAAFTRFREPLVRVANLDIQTLWHDPRLLTRARDALADWSHNGAPPPHVAAPGGRGPFTVHTYTATVGATEPQDLGKWVKTPTVGAHPARAPPE
mgnify:CR=1 FL=1